jgi:hypothetical protein
MQKKQSAFTKNLFKERLSLKRFFVFNTIFVAAILVLSNVILVLSLVYVVATKKIYMQPPFALTETTELDYTKGKLYEETLENFAENFISLSENLTPDNVEMRTAKVKKFLNEEFYKVFAPALDKRVEELKANNMTRAFYISKIDTTKPGELQILGIRSKSIGQQILQSQKVKMIILYELDSSIQIKKIIEETK